MAASTKTLSKEQIANLSKREKTTILIAILSLYFVVCSTMTISPALQTPYNAFPDFDRTTVMYIYTLPSLVGIPVTILIGLIAGTKVRYRTILLSATALMVVMGVAPFFIDNLYAILACRFLFGIGQASCLGVEVSREGDGRASAVMRFPPAAGISPLFRVARRETGRIISQHECANPIEWMEEL